MSKIALMKMATVRMSYPIVCGVVLLMFIAMIGNDSGYRYIMYRQDERINDLRIEVEEMKEALRIEVEEMKEALRKEVEEMKEALRKEINVDIDNNTIHIISWLRQHKHVYHDGSVIF